MTKFLRSLLEVKWETLPKAQRTWGLSSYHKFKHKSWLNFIFKISTKPQLQNLDQTSASLLDLEFKLLTKPSFRSSTKIQLHSLNKTSAAKYGSNSSFKSSLNFNFNTYTKFVKKVPQPQFLSPVNAYFQHLLICDKIAKIVWNGIKPMKSTLFTFYCLF